MSPLSDSHTRTHVITNAIDPMLAEIRKLAPEIASRAAEIEAARRMPPELVEKLKETGLSRVVLPRLI